MPEEKGPKLFHEPATLFGQPDWWKKFAHLKLLSSRIEISWGFAKLTSKPLECSRFAQ